MAATRYRSLVENGGEKFFSETTVLLTHTKEEKNENKCHDIKPRYSRIQKK